MDTIYIMCRRSPFLFTFNYELKEVGNKIWDSINKYLPISYGICVDDVGNFIFASFKNCANYIFDKQGIFIRKFADDISNPMGVTVDSKGRIIASCY